MPRDLPLGNGDLLVTFDSRYQLRDIFYPYVGMENHTVGDPSRFGIWADGAFAWTGDDGWDRSIAYEHETLVGDTTLGHPKLGVLLHVRDAVDFGRARLDRERRYGHAHGARRGQRARRLLDRRRPGLRRGARARQARPRAHPRLIPRPHQGLLAPLGEQGRVDHRPPPRRDLRPLQALDTGHPHAGRQPRRDHRRERLRRPALQPRYLLVSLAAGWRVGRRRARPCGLRGGDAALLRALRNAHHARGLPPPQIQPGRLAWVLMARVVDAGRTARASDPRG